MCVLLLSVTRRKPGSSSGAAMQDFVASRGLVKEILVVTFPILKALRAFFGLSSIRLPLSISIYQGIRLVIAYI